MTKTTRTTSAAELAAQIETARGLVLALETLTAAGDYSPAGVHNAAARRPQADAVLQALADQLDQMQAAADQLDEAEAARLSPADDQSGAALCAQDADQRSGEALPDQSGSGYTLDSGEPLADFARRVQRLDADQLDQLEAAEQKRSRRTRKGGAAQ